MKFHDLRPDQIENLAKIMRVLRDEPIEKFDGSFNDRVGALILLGMNVLINAPEDDQTAMIARQILATMPRVSMPTVAATGTA